MEHRPRITEALIVTPEDLHLDGPRPFVRLRTLKQRSRGRPAKDEKIARVVPLLDESFVSKLRRYLATFRPGRRTLLFPITRKTAWSWMKYALAKRELSLPSIPLVREHCVIASLCSCF